MEAIMVDRTAAAAAEIDRHNAAEADKDNVLELFTPWESDKAKSTDEIATLRQKLAVEDKAQSTPIDRTAAAGTRDRHDKAAAGGSRGAHPGEGPKAPNARRSA
jgi:hypothetical protein